MDHIEITILDDWPRIKMVINTSRGARTESSMFDVAFTNFEVHAKNALRTAVEEIINRRKRSN